MTRWTTCTSTVSLLWVAALLGGFGGMDPAEAQVAEEVRETVAETEGSPAGEGVSDPLMERAHGAVSALLGARWNVDPGVLVLEWGEAARSAFSERLQAVELMGTGGGGHWVVAFFDPSPGGERVQVVLRAGVMIPVPVAARPLARNEVLTPDDMAWETRIHWGDPSNRDPQAQSGWEVQRTLQAGEVLERPAVAPPKVVLSGKPVQVLWRRGTLTVTVMGKAAGTAALGESVYVRTESGQRLRGIASGPGQVTISDRSSEEMS